MMRLARVAFCFTVVCGLALPASWTIARADDATPTPAPSSDVAPTPAPAAATPDTTAAPADAATQSADAAAPAPTLNDLVDTSAPWQDRHDLAADAGRKILASGSDPNTILQAFESVAARHNDGIDIWMLRWALRSRRRCHRFAAAAKEMRSVAAKLWQDIINQGYATRRADPNYIRQTLYEMSAGARAYDNNMPRLAESGEVAVKVIIDMIRDPQQEQYHSTCRRALRNLGRKALNPLLAATEMKDYDTLIDVISALGDIDYDVAVPYLARLARASDVPASIHTASRNALFHIGIARNAPLETSGLFYALAEKFYYGKSDIEPAGDKVSYIWYWTSDLGLTRRDVPTPIFNDLLAMRAAEYAMKLDASNGAAVSLWLDANTKREADLPAGQIDITHKDDPDANYYNVSAGADYLNDALARATRDRNAAVALKLCNSLRNITGQSNLGGDAITPLMQALYFPNRQVRYAAAFALAQTLPSKPFAGADRVVPLLVEAVNQTTTPGVRIVAPASGATLTDADLRDAVQSLGYPVIAASNPTDAAAAAILSRPSNSSSFPKTATCAKWSI